MLWPPRRFENVKASKGVVLRIDWFLGFKNYVEICLPKNSKDLGYWGTKGANVPTYFF